VDERARRRYGSAADASTAVHADVFALTQAIGQIRYEGAETGGTGRDMGIGNGMGEELDSGALRRCLFVFQAQPLGLAFFQERDQSVDAAALEAQHFIVKAASAAGSGDNRQARRRISIDPENVRHGHLYPYKALDPLVHVGNPEPQHRSLFDERQNFVEVGA